MAKDNLTKQANISTTIREVDFVSRFNTDWEALRAILGITRPIRKMPGTKLEAIKASVTLQSGSVAEGDEIPYSLANVESVPLGDITIEKYAKGVSIEAVAKYGAQNAVIRTDDAFAAELQNNITGRFYTFLKSGTLTNVQTTFQKALAMAKGHVVNMWKAMNKSITEVVGFANVLDAYEYIGAANISTQRAFGMEYLKDFMGYRVVFLMDDSRIPQGKVIATPVENVVAYYIDPADSDFATLGLNYTTAGETPFLGFHAEGDYKHAVGDMYAILGLTLFAEYLNGIAVVTVESSGSADSLTVASAAATTTTGKTKLTLNAPLAANVPADWSFYFKEASSSAPSIDYLAKLDNTWTAIPFEEDSTKLVADEFTATSGYKATIVAVNGTGQVVAKSGAVTITVKA